MLKGFETRGCATEDFGGKVGGGLKFDEGKLK